MPKVKSATNDIDKDIWSASTVFVQERTILRIKKLSMTNSDPLINQLCVSVPFRNRQLEVLHSLLAQDGDPLPHALFLYGSTATGKSLVIREVLQAIAIPNAIINCRECYDSRLLFESSLAQLTQQDARCENLMQFVRALQSWADQDPEKQNKPFCLVLDTAEVLRDYDTHLLPGLLSLQGLSRLNVCVILISQVPWHKFYSGTNVVEPLPIHFPQYSLEEIRQLLLREALEESKDLFQHFIKLFLSVFWLACRDFAELKHMCRLHWPAFKKPVDSGECDAKDVMRLWRNIEPYLKQVLPTIYQRGTVSQEQLILELPFFSKYLLIAAYLASYNPSKYDRRLFLKNSGKQRKHPKTQAAREKHLTALLGPKPFPLNRWLAIFFAIVEEKIAPTSLLLTQIAALKGLHLVTTHGLSVGLQTSQKYKCALGSDVVRALSKSVQFDIVRYLYNAGTG